MNLAELFSWLRAMSGGKLTQAQVDAANKIIEVMGVDALAQLIGYTLNEVSGQIDISEKGYSIIREFEGFKAEAYLDTGGVWTIGYGTIRYPNGSPVRKGDRCSKEQAEIWLKNDCIWVDGCLDKYIKVSITQNQFDALASFVYNVGETAFKTSTLLTKLNAKDYTGAANQLDRWVNDNGKRIQGLVNRRAKEKALFLSN